jgi:transcriptional regulator with XRE-family HTH domain
MSLAELDIDGRISARIRALRAARGLTLEALAGLADVSRAMLSRIERGESSPTAQLLNKVCGGLGITLSELFAESEQPASPLARLADQRTWRDPASGYLRRNVSPTSSGSSVQIVEIEFPPGESVVFDNDRVAGKDQQIWVLAGVLSLEFSDETVRLEAGDCFYMRFGRPIRFHNPSPRPTRYAVILNRGQS